MPRPLSPATKPMEALSVDRIPVGPQWQYEPKWDGFRCLAFRSGKSISLKSKSGKPLTRYFPELVEALSKLKADPFVLDGEIMVADSTGYSFDQLLQRIHPAASRIAKLAKETPAIFVAFDLLADKDGALNAEPLSVRRPRLEHFAKRVLSRNKTIRLSIATTKLSDAKRWLKRVGDTLDGIIAKRRDLAYASGDRTGMQKIKNYRSADCVVGGFRYNEGTAVVGSLLLGLYNTEGKLDHVGFTSALTADQKPALTKKLKKLIGPPGFTGNAPGGPSRWSTARSAEWQPLKPKLVVEVTYDHFSGDRFRHGTNLVRWRPDKSPKQCTSDQVNQKKTNLTILLK